MKKHFILSIIMFVVILSTTAEESSPPTIAIMDVVATNTSDLKSQIMYKYILGVVNRSKSYTILERSALHATIEKMGISISNMLDDTTAIEIGKLADVDFILLSNLIVNNDITSLATHVIEVETGQIRNTATFEAGESEYMAFLALRTISKLLGVSERKLELPSDMDETIVDETIVDETTIKSDRSKFSLTLGAAGTIPNIDEDFDMGYNIVTDINYKMKSFSKNEIYVGVGSGLAIEKTSSESGVIFPYSLVGIPLLFNVKYKINIANFYFEPKIAAGGVVNFFIYTETPPPGFGMLVVVPNLLLSSGLSLGYNLSERFSMALFSDWSSTFFKNEPHSILFVGFAVDIKL